MCGKNITFDYRKINKSNFNNKKINKINFCKNKKLFKIGDINASKMLVSKKESYGSKKKTFKYFI